MRTSLVWILALAAAGCGIEHRTAAYGRAYRESMAMQVKPAAVPAAPTNTTLDTQEAGVISGTYLRSLAGKSAQGTETEPVLYVAPTQRQGAGSALAPSVPKE